MNHLEVDVVAHDKKNLRFPRFMLQALNGKGSLEPLESFVLRYKHKGVYMPIHGAVKWINLLEKVAMPCTNQVKRFTLESDRKFRVSFFRLMRRIFPGLEELNLGGKVKVCFIDSYLRNEFKSDKLKKVKFGTAPDRHDDFFPFNKSVNLEDVHMIFRQKEVMQANILNF